MHTARSDHFFRRCIHRSVQVLHPDSWSGSLRSYQLQLPMALFLRQIRHNSYQPLRSDLYWSLLQMRSLPRSHQQIRLALSHILLISGYEWVWFCHWSHFWSLLSQSFHLLRDRPVHMWSRILSGTLWIHGFQWLLLMYHMVFLKLQESHLPDVSLQINIRIQCFHSFSSRIIVSISCCATQMHFRDLMFLHRI